jgi:hypothetical protein
MLEPGTQATPAQTPTLNDIPARQNESHMLKLLRAKTAAYDRAQWLYCLQFVTLVVAPVVLAVWQRLSPGASWVAGAIALLLVITDVYPVEPIQKRWKFFGALFQEQFDCTLFHLQWRRDRNGPPPSSEEVHRWSTRHQALDGLRDWYSPVVGCLPPLAATVVCQRINGYWNATMRSRYSATVQGAVFVLVIIVLGVTLSADLSARTVFAASAFSLPLIRWISKEITYQREAATASRRVVERTDRLWDKLVEADVTTHVLQQDIRELQNDILDQRRRDPMVFGWAYSWWRAKDEETMRVGAEELVEEYSRTGSRHA